MLCKKMMACALVAVMLWLAAGCATNPDGNPMDKGKLPSAQETPQSTLPAGSPGPDAKDRPIDSSLKLPSKLRMDGDEPTVKVHVVADKKTQDMPLETYLQGVLAGEMKNDWPLEALKAQAILARTFALKFLEEKESKYQDADLSTDIEEAQAYDASGINDRIKQAVSETRGLVLNAQGTLPFAWFHAHSGGLTALAKEGLEYEKEDPPYIHSVAGRESNNAPKDVQDWTATFSAAEVLRAARKVGASGDTLTGIQIGQRGPSERATTLVINGANVPAGSFRIALGSTKMKSTLLSSLTLEGDKVTIKGRGYGHGVGMSQWGAFGLAEQGQSADAIVQYYFNQVTVSRVW